MPVTNNKPDVFIRWNDAQTGIVGSTTSSLARLEISRGWKRSPGDRKNVQLPFLGREGYGEITRSASPLLDTYIPTIDDPGSHWGAWAVSPLGNAPMVYARNSSWDKLLEKVRGDTSSLGAAAAEGRETFDMVARRTTGLYRAYRALRKGDFKKFLKELSVDPKRKHRSTVRTASNEAAGVWLEYWFGWAPTVQDIGSAALALSSNPVLSSVREHGSSRFVCNHAVTGRGGGRSRATITNAGGGFVKQGATFTLSNQNLFLANRCGLVNPLAVAWELVPFSFVIDWFTKFGSYLHGFTDLVGLEVSDPYSTSYISLEMTGRYWNTHPSTAGNECHIRGRLYGHFRSTSLSRPIPVAPKIANFGSSLTRAATAVSLLTSVFLDGAPPRR